MAVAAAEEGAAVEIGDDADRGVVGAGEQGAEGGQARLSHNLDRAVQALGEQIGEVVERQAAEQHAEPGIISGAGDRLLLRHRLTQRARHVGDAGRPTEAGIALIFEAALSIGRRDRQRPGPRHQLRIAVGRSRLDRRRVRVVIGRQQQRADLDPRDDDQRNDRQRRDQSQPTHKAG